MSTQRSIISYLLNRYAGGQDSRESGGSRALLGRIKPRRSDMVFLTLAIGLLVVFLIAGVVELISATPISKWLTDAWNAILGASPQSVQQAVSQPPNVQLPNATIGDMLGSLGRVLLAPLDAILAMLLLIFAIFVRLRGYIGRVVSPERLKSFNIVSWITLVASFIPPVVDGLW